MDRPANDASGKRRWPALVLISAWAVALVIAGVWSAHQDQATVRAQSDLAEGRRTLDRAVTEVVTAAGPVGTQVLQYRTSDCQISMARDGTSLERVVVLDVPRGREEAMLDRLVDELPSQWHPRHGVGGRFHADAGDFVRLDGEVVDPGLVRLTASTGCRPGEDPALSGGSAEPRPSGPRQ